MRQRPLIENVEISDLAAEGNALARYENKVIFIPYGAPGDKVNILINRDKKKYAEGEIKDLLVASPQRQDAFCSHFGTCGGCKLQHLQYDAQLHFKTKQVTDNLERIGKISFPPVNTILGSKETTHYRNKLEYTFSNKRWLTNEEISSEGELERNALGFHMPGKFDKILDIKECFLQPSPSNEIRNELKRYALEKGHTFFDIREHHGLLRTVAIRTAITGELMVIVQFFEANMEAIKETLDNLKHKFPQITSLMYIINQKKNDSWQDQDVILWHGKDHIIEEMEGLQFRVGPKSFYQTNSKQAYTLYQVTRDFADLQGDELVYDLYTGTGTIANFVARKAKKVIGVEYVEMAIEDAKLNSVANNINNTAFYAGDMKDVLNEAFLQTNGTPDVIITDPPRNGMHEDVVNMLLRIGAKKIVYVSCNPATQARDLAFLDGMYAVTKVQPVDMFPHTHHVENVVLLEKR